MKKLINKKSNKRTKQQIQKKDKIKKIKRLRKITQSRLRLKDRKNTDDKFSKFIWNDNILNKLMKENLTTNQQIELLVISSIYEMYKKLYIDKDILVEKRGTGFVYSLVDKKKVL